MEFKERLVHLRKEVFKLTQEEFAKKIGYTRSAISAWEIGRNEPSNDDIVKLADFFGVSTDYLLGKTNESIINNNYSFAYHKETEGLSDEEIKDALNFYKEMKNKIDKKEKKG